ncbi:MAG: M48 family metallopeptidase [Nitrosomonas sp.]|nr:M48 family metallopeptidase [Nitrosomonas sp.]
MLSIIKASSSALWLNGRRSCTVQNNIIKNPELIAASKDCFDYVITRVLCHLKKRNHSPAFYELLSTILRTRSRDVSCLLEYLRLGLFDYCFSAGLKEACLFSAQSTN